MGKTELFIGEMINTVFCPVINEQIDGTTCLDIVLVADKEAKTSILPNWVKWNEEQRKKCLTCKYHSDMKNA